MRVRTILFFIIGMVIGAALVQEKIPLGPELLILLIFLGLPVVALYRLIAK